jgi:hypothetical protein
MITTQDLLERLPRTSSVFGSSWLNRIWPSEHDRLIWYRPWLEQIEIDLKGLEKHIPLSRLTGYYRPGLRDLGQILQTAYEIHGAALLGAAAMLLRLHVSRGDAGGKNFDVQAEIEGVTINADSKTRDDDFLNPRYQLINDPDGLTGFARERPLVDPHEAAALGIPMQHAPGGEHRQEVPEATIIKSILLDAGAQLPSDGINIVLLGQKSGDRKDLQRALGGTEASSISRNRRTGEVWLERTPVPTGAFDPGPLGEPFRGISGVLWIRLIKLDGEKLYRAYKLYPNQSANSHIPATVSTAIEDIISSWELLPPSSVAE